VHLGDLFHQDRAGAMSDVTNRTSAPPSRLVRAANGTREVCDDHEGYVASHAMWVCAARHFGAFPRPALSSRID
jgi:hypothetical protein